MSYHIVWRNSCHTMLCYVMSATHDAVSIAAEPTNSLVEPIADEMHYLREDSGEIPSHLRHLPISPDPAPMRPSNSHAGPTKLQDHALSQPVSQHFPRPATQNSASTPPITQHSAAPLPYGQNFGISSPAVAKNSNSVNSKLADSGLAPSVSQSWGVSNSASHNSASSHRQPYGVQGLQSQARRQQQPIDEVLSTYTVDSDAQNGLRSSPHAHQSAPRSAPQATPHSASLSRPHLTSGTSSGDRSVITRVIVWTCLLLRRYVYIYVCDY